MALVDVKLL